MIYLPLAIVQTTFQNGFHPARMARFPASLVYGKRSQLLCPTRY